MFSGCDYNITQEANTRFCWAGFSFINSILSPKIKEKRANIYSKTLLKLHKNQKKDGSKKDLA
jgi:hypothetical protein